MSKTTLHLALALTLIDCAQEQKPLNCAPCHTGRFVDTMMPNYVLSRTQTEQFEEVRESGHVSVSKIKWIDDCTYALTGRRITQGQADPIAVDDTLKVTITSVDAEGFDYEAEFNTSNPDLTRREFSGRQLFLR